MTTPIDTAAKRMGDYQANRGALARRTPHALLDSAVTLNAGATGVPHNKGGAELAGGTGRVGYVWAVEGGKALVDFGATSSGHGLRMVCNPADLTPVEA